MTREQEESEVGELLQERAELSRLHLELPPNLLQRLKSLLIKLGWTNMKFRRRELVNRLARAAGVKRYSEPFVMEDMHNEMENEGRWEPWRPGENPEEQENDDEDETPQLTQVPTPQLAKPDQYRPDRNKWYKKPEGHTLLFDLPDGRTFEMDVSEHNLNGVGVHNLTFNDDRGSYLQTGKGGAKSVFDQIAPAIVSYMKAKKPPILTFTAAETDSEAGPQEGKSRQRVYQKLVTTLAKLDPDYAAGFAEDPSGKGTRAYFVFDRNKIDQVEQVVGQRIAGHQQVVRPLVMSRVRSLLRRYAKVDARHEAHPLVQGFPIETFLRHLSNDPSNHESIRELAKIAVTGGKNRDASNVGTALWALHDALEEHNHPKKGVYNLLSAADKIGLDAHTYRALRESADATRRANSPVQVRGFQLPNANEMWGETPEAHATMAVQGMDDLPVNSSYSINRKELLNRIRSRVKELSPQSQDSDVDESIRRHAHRSNKVWRKIQGMSDENGRDLESFKERKYPVPRPHLNANEKATRYRRLLRRMARKIGPKRYQFPSSSEHVTPSGLKIVHKKSGGAVGIDGKPSTAHQYVIHAPNAKPVDLILEHRQGDENAFLHWVGTDDGLKGGQNTLGPAAMREIQRAISLRHPEVKRLSGLRVGRREQAPVNVKLRRTQIALKRYEMVAGDFIDALRRIRSEQQKGIRHTVETIAAKIGAKPASTVDALADSPHYSVPGVAQAIYSNTAPEAIHALAAWAGLTGNIPGMAVFHYRPNGPDLLHRFRMAGSGQELRAKLDKAGIQNRVLIPHRSGFDVLVPDKKGTLNDAVKGFTKQQKTELQTSKGHFMVTGSADQAKAREMFRDAVTKQEQGVA